MDSLKKFLNNFHAETIAFFFIALTFFFLPTGTAPPLISIGLAFIVWLFFVNKGEFIIIVRKDWFFIALIFIILPWAGLLYSKDFDLGLDYALKTKYWIAVIITAGIGFHKKRVDAVLMMFLASLSIGAILAILQFFEIVEAFNPKYLGFGIVHSLISMYLLIGVLVASFYYKIADSNRKRLVSILLVILFLIHLSILRGRNGYFVFFLLTPYIVNNLMCKFKIISKIFVVLTLVASLLLSPVVKDRAKKTINQMKQKQVILSGQLKGGFTRPYMFHSTIKIFLNHPFVGIGTGSLKYYTTKMGHSVNHPHNNLLYMTVSFGIVGFVVYFLLFWKMFIASWKHRETPLGNFILSICLVLFFGGIFETLILNSGTALLLPMGYGLINHLDLDS